MTAAESSRAQPAAEIRPATPADLDRLIDIAWSVAAEGRWIGTEVPFDRDSRRAARASALSDESSTVLVAEAATGEDSAPVVVGEVAVSVAPYGVANLSMMLLDGWRGRGLGTALLEAGVAWARAAGAHKVALEVWPHNEPALRLYRRAGFVEEGRKRRHYRRANGELWDSVLMGLPLS